MVKLLVCGGRNFSDYYYMKNILGAFKSNLKRTENKSIDVLISGAAKGADRLAEKWAKENNIEVEQYFPDWDTYGKAAGFIRNKTMLEDGKPDYVIAFSGGKGTANMIKLAKEANVMVLEV